MSGHDLSGCACDHSRNASYAYFLTVSAAMSTFDFAEHAHDARTDDETHHEREDREHDHDLEQGHAALSARGEDGW